MLELTQEDLAELAGKTTRHIRNWERKALRFVLRAIGSCIRLERLSPFGTNAKSR